MKCKNESCNNECKGNSAYCCESCRTLYNRNNRNSGTGTIPAGTPEQSSGTPAGTVKSEQITLESVDIDPDPAAGTCQKLRLKLNTPAYKNLDKRTLSVTNTVKPASLEDYYDPDGRQYATRTNPELLNWCEPMTADELRSYAFKHKLPHYHNRIPIPGDHDYKGVCEQVGTTWRVKQ